MTQTYKDITYTLTKSDRKTASIYIERDGQVSVLVPKTLTDLEVNRLIETKRRWIYRNLAEWQDTNATRIRRQFVSGEGFLYLGRSYRLKLVEQQSEPLLLKDGYFCLKSDDGDLQDPSAAFKTFYKAKGQKRIDDRVGHYSDRMGVEPAGVRILELKNRWASCTPEGRLNFHWKCMMAPATVLDYIVVHELAHLKYLNHTRAFWNLVDRVLPDYRERKDWLRQNGAGMDL
jgi:predicted metal-dependent hydrolase